MSELNTIFGTEKKIKIADREISIKTVSLGDLPIVTGIIEKVVSLLPQIKKDQNAAILKFVTTDFDSVIKLLCATTSLSKEEISNLNPAAATLIFSAVIKENSSFLAEHVAPAIKEATKGFSEAKEKASGSGQSKD